MSKEQDGYMAVLALLVAIAIVGVIMLYEAWVLVLGWGWFIVPLGAPPIGYAHALGLAAIIGLITKSAPKNDDDAKWAFLGRGVLRITVTLAFMFVYSLFM